MDLINLFQENNAQVKSESYWRSIILFGRNTASYKFALAKALIYFAEKNKTNVSLEDLSKPFAQEICQHLEHSPRQTVSSQEGIFLESCRLFNSEEISRAKLLEITEKNAFNFVLDAFHNVNREKTDISFFEEDKKNKSIILTDELFYIKEKDYLNILKKEVESRWNLVETSWHLKINPNILEAQVNYDASKKMFFVNDELKRKDVTSVRESLNGYQKGQCFYCYRPISIFPDSPDFCDVDHVYPHKIKKYLKSQVNIDGAWNLVLSCEDCNRGKNGKFDNLAHKKYIERLFKRNEYLIISHNPLKETLQKQTGQKNKDRLAFYQRMDNEALNLLPTKNRWTCNEEGVAMF